MRNILKGEKKQIAIAAAVIVLAAVFVYELLEHLSPVKEFLSALLRVVAPILYGLALAFVLDLPMTFLERTVFKKLRLKKPKLTRGICIAVCFALFLGAVAFAASLIVPKVVDSVFTLVNDLGSYVQAVTDQLDRWSAELELGPEAYELLGRISESAMERASDLADNVVPQVFKLTVNAITVVYSLLIAFVISVHGLARKEKLVSFAKRTAAAFIPKGYEEGFFRYCSYSNRVFKRYIAGQLASCLILASLCYIAMRIFGMPYPELISVFIFAGALIPIIGPWVSTLASALIILISRIDDPWLALWFIVIIVTLQMLDDNLIAPRIVGDAIGVPGILVIAAIVIAGGLFGVGGLLIAVPSAAVIYKLFGDWVNRRNREKETSDRP